MAVTTDRIGEMRYRPEGSTYRVVATLGNGYFGFEATEPPGGGPPLQIQTCEVELFVVLEGKITFWLDGQVIKRSAGGTVLVPPGVPHCFKNTSDRPARALILFTPGDIEGFFAPRITARWGVANLFSLMQQLGAWPRCRFIYRRFISRADRWIRPQGSLASTTT